MRASDFRAAARRALSGKWIWAVLAGLIASLLGGIDESFPEFSVHIEGGQVESELSDPRSTSEYKPN